MLPINNQIVTPSSTSASVWSFEENTLYTLAQQLNIASNQRSGFVCEILPLFANVACQNDKANLATTVSMLFLHAHSIADMFDTFNSIMPTLTQAKSVDEKFARLYAIDSRFGIPVADREAFVNDTCALFTKSAMTASDKFLIALALTKISPARRSLVVSQALHIWQQRMDVNEKIASLWAIDFGVPLFDKNAVNLLFLNTSSIQEKYFIASFFKDIPHHLKQRFVTDMMYLLSTKGQLNSVERKIEVMCALDLAIRQPALKIPFGWLGGSANEINYTTLLTQTNVPSSVVRSALDLANTEGADEKLLQRWLTEGSLQIPSNERTSFVQTVLPLVVNTRKYSRNILETYLLALAVSVISPQMRAQAVKAELHPWMGIDEKTLHLFCASIWGGRSRAARDPVVQQLLPLAYSTLSIVEKYHLTFAASGIAPSERSQVVYYVLPMSGIDEKMLYLWASSWGLNPSHRVTFVQLLLPSIRERKSFEDKQNLAVLFSYLTQSELENVINDKMKQVIPTMSPDEKLLHLLAGGLNMPAAERGAFVKQALPLISSEEEMSDKYKIARALACIAPAKREQVIGEVLPTFTQVMETDEKLLRLWVSVWKPQEERKLFVEQALPLITLLGSSLAVTTAEKHDLALAFSFIIPTTRKQVAQEMPRVFTQTMNVDEKLLHLWVSAWNMPPIERGAFIRQVTPLIRGIASVAEKHDITAAFFHLTPVERAKVTNGRPLPVAMKLDERLLHLWANGWDIPQAERGVFVEHLLPLIAFGTTIAEKHSLAAAYLLIASTERGKAVNNALPMLTQMMRVDEKLLHLWIAPSPWDQETKRTFVEQVLPLISSTDSIPDKYYLAMACVLLPLKKRDQAVKEALSIFTQTVKGIDEKAIHIVAASLASKTSFIKLAQALLGKYHTNIEKLKFLKTVANAPSLHSEEAANVISALTDAEKKTLIDSSFFQCIRSSKNAAFVQDIMPVLQPLCKAAPEDPALIFLLLPARLKRREKILEKHNLLKDLEYRNVILASLQDILISENYTPEILKLFASFAAKLCTKWMMIQESHIVAQRGQRMVIAFDKTGNKNPLTIYNKLTKYVGQAIAFQPPVCQFAGKNSSFSLKKLQEFGSAFQITRDELPKDATKEAWNTLVTNFKGRMESEPQARQELLNLGTTWDAIWKDCLSDPFLAYLFRSKEEEVSLAEAQFCAYVHYLLAQESRQPPNEPFSQQEHVLIKMAMQIRACASGKKEAIAILYSKLEDSYQYPGKKFTTGDDGKDAALSFIASEMQKILQEQFCGTNALMHELTCEPNEVQQVPHQAMYLKNLIGPLVGLHHQLEFDLHTHLLYDAMVAKTREEALGLLFKYLTPQMVVETLLKKSNDPAHSHKVKRHFSRFIKDLDGGAVQLEDDDETVKFTEQGVLQILQIIGYIQCE